MPLAETDTDRVALPEPTCDAIALDDTLQAFAATARPVALVAQVAPGANVFATPDRPTLEWGHDAERVSVPVAFHPVELVTVARMPASNVAPPVAVMSVTATKSPASVPVAFESVAAVPPVDDLIVAVPVSAHTIVAEPLSVVVVDDGSVSLPPDATEMLPVNVLAPVSATPPVPPGTFIRAYDWPPPATVFVVAEESENTTMEVPMLRLIPPAATVQPVVDVSVTTDAPNWMARVRPELDVKPAHVTL